MQKWQAQISVNGVTKNLGFFQTKEAAALRYNKHAKRIWGQFAPLNDIPNARLYRLIG
jgi:hypothetical protein